MAPGGRTIAIAFLAILTAPLLLSLITDEAIAQKSSDPWWGPSSPSEPTNGWAIRIPVVIENNRSYTMRNAPVSVELDFTRILLDGGWTAQTVGSEERLRGFTLDVDSIRVIEYGRGFASGPINGPDTEPVPHTFFEAPLQGARTRDFDASRNPSGTLMFLATTLFPAEKRYYYVYANPLEFAKTAPAKFDEKRSAPLQAYLWGTAGTVTYGYVPQQSNQLHRIQVALHSSVNVPTSVTISEYSFSKFSPVPSTTQFPNPVVLTSGNPTATFFVPAGKFFKVESAQPVVVAVHGATTNDGSAPIGHTDEAFSFVPSTTNSYAGNQFRVFGFRANQNGAGSVTVIKANSGGSVTVTSAGSTARLTDAAPAALLRVPNGWSTVTVSPPDARILISNVIFNSGPFQGYTVPALNGGPEGTRFLASVPYDGGFARVCTGDPLTLRIADMANANQQLYPPGPFATTPAARISGDTCTRIDATASYPTGGVIDHFSTKEATDPAPDSPVPFRLTVGAAERSSPDIRTRPFMGPYAGLYATDFFVEGDAVGVVGHYDNTKLTITESFTRGPAVNRTSSVSADGVTIIQPASTDSAKRYHIVATKPVTVLTMQSVADNHAYGYYLGGRPVEPLSTVGLAEFRGPLIDLRAPETTSRQVFRSAGPGTPVTFSLETVNFGRWIGGDNLPDRITITCSGLPDGWELKGCEREVRLDSRAAERFDVLVTPSADDVNATRTILVTATSSAQNVVAQMKLIVHVEIRYGVGLWFDVEGGRKTIDPPVGLNPGERHTYKLVLKNTGSSTDIFEMTVESPRQGWTQSLQRNGEPVTRVELGGGESTLLEFTVTAPPTETAQQNIVRITAQSISSAAAADIVNTASRIRPKVDVRLTLDPPTSVAVPGEAARFNLTVMNSGNDIFRIRLREDSILPQGWSSDLTVTELDLGPGTPFTFPLYVTPPAGARAGDLATLKIAAETDTGDGGGALPGDEVSAVVVVRKLHNITSPPLLDALAHAGDTFTYVLPIQNSGNGDEVVEILPGASTPAWRLTSDTQTVFLDRNATADLTLNIDVPPLTPPGDLNYTFTVRLSRETTQNLTVPVKVLPTARLAFEGLENLTVLPGQSRQLRSVVTNVGNIPAEFNFAASAPAEWNVTFEPAAARLEPGAKIPVAVTINASRDTLDGDYVVELKTDAAAEVGGVGLVGTKVGRPDLFVQNIVTTGRPRNGDLVIVTATIGNRGNTAAENATIALFVDGEPVDSVLMARIPVGEPKVATLSWVATRSSSDVTISIDPQNDLVEVSRDENVAVVEFGSRLGIPAMGVAATTFAIALIALALRRRSA